MKKLGIPDLIHNFVFQSTFYMKKEEQITHIAEIKAMMEKSTRFLSLSGLSGVAAGTIALIGAAIAFFALDYHYRYTDIDAYFSEGMYCQWRQNLPLLIADGIGVLVLAIGSAVFFTIRKAKKDGNRLWNSAAKRLVINLFIPLATGGVVCLIMLYHGFLFLVAPFTLIFYGLALLNASKFTLDEIRSLGMAEILLGIVATIFLGYGLLFWAIGFGIFHIVYGIYMYRKHGS
jgi:hypothetical protein